MTIHDIPIDAILDLTSPYQGELHRPYISRKAKLMVQSVLDSTIVSTYGNEVALCEDKLAQITECPQIVLVSSGTVALETCLRALGAAGKYVLCPSFTFAATANAIVNSGATPYFYEVDGDLEPDIECIADLVSSKFSEQNGRWLSHDDGMQLAGAVVVDLFGHIPDFDGLRNLSREMEFFIIEDGAEALGSTRSSKGVGASSDCAILSFNGNKIVTAGGGGAILTRDESLGARCRELTNTAKIPHPYRFRHSAVSSNLRMPALNAALLLGQLEELDIILDAKRKLHRAYRAIFKLNDSLTLFDDNQCQTSNYWLNNVSVSNRSSADDVIQTLRASGIGARPAWDPLHTQAPYEKFPRTNLDITELTAQAMISLPSSPELGLNLP